MDFNLLGPLEVRDAAGREIGVPAGRERALLVLLLINRGEVVSVDRIVDALWGEHPPETAAKAIQGYVSHLRRLLGHETGQAVLLTQAPGYVLRADGTAHDAARFVQLAGEARRALEDGDAAGAALVLDDALALWRGPALAEFAFDDFARDEIHRLEELRLAAMEDRFESLLRLGRHGELVGQLDSLVAAHPLRERLRGQAMLALYRSGRQADALEVYGDGRRLLDSELGLTPGPELQRLHRAILEQDSELEAAPAPPPGGDRGDGRAVSRPGRPHGRRRLESAALLLAVVTAAAVVVAVVLARDNSPAAVAIIVPSVVAVDPATNRVVASIPVGSKPASIAAGDGEVWVGDARDGTLTRIDPVSMRVIKTIGIGAPAIDLAIGAGSVWAATGGFGTIVQVDPDLGAVTDRVELGDPGDPVVPAASSVGVSGGRVWVGTFDGLARIDPRSGTITARVDLGKTPALQTAVGGDAIWATTIARRAKRVEASSARVTAEFYSGKFAIAIARAGAAVWLAAADDGELWKLDSVTGATILTARAGRGASGIAVGLDAVWVTSWHDRSLVRVDPASGDVLAQIPTSGEPEDVAVGDGLVWVAVQPAAS